uniref:LEMD2 n=1 Tax=Caenorhabditis tropicalis TaxID=1561998 RepID=A0A1I7TNH6_9PELO
MCGNHELESSDYSSDEDTDSVDSFHSVGTEKTARRWAYTILFCYTFLAIAFMTMFVVWFFSKDPETSSNEKKYEE